MAFCSRFGTLMKQTISQNNGPVPVASMLNAMRCMSSTRLFIGGLSYETDNQSLKDAFSCFGDVVDARVVTERETGRSRGFGFVNFATDESASSALSGMDGQELNGRNIRVVYATDRPARGSASGGGFGSGGYRGGFGNARE
ncbi:glycine-rich RNA-binding protein 2, mitochondrial-like isoform X2 [Diospyros lotus]|nr:glycine-rich RNA-binding protein 2, mitochondrial-like isoform X2 [Diospyros lotus]